MDVFIALGHSAAAAFSASLAISGFMIYAGIGDEPVSRSSHAERTPTSGGLGLIAAMGAGIFCLGLFYPYQLGDGPLLGQVLSIALAVAFLGLTDDIYGGRALFKMGLLLGLSALLVWALGPVHAFPINAVSEFTLPYTVAFAGTMLWVFVVTNVVNFMDGSNGMMGVSLSIAALALIPISLLSNAPMAMCLSMGLAAGLLGFLPYNFRTKARIFSGDVGALFAGFIFAAATVLLVHEGHPQNRLFVGPLLILPFLTDVFLTLIRRVRRGENLVHAHNQHLYQRLIQSGWGHRRTAVAYGVAGIICAVLAIIGSATLMIESLPLFAGIIALAIVIYTGMIWRLKRKAEGV